MLRYHIHESLGLATGLNDNQSARKISEFIASVLHRNVPDISSYSIEMWLTKMSTNKMTDTLELFSFRCNEDLSPLLSVILLCFTLN